MKNDHRSLQARTSLLKHLVIPGFCTALLGVAATAAAAPVPPPEKLLPDDTLVVLTAPDFPKARASLAKLPLMQVLADPAMKPVCDHFITKFNDEFLQPLERELHLKPDSYASLVQGQLTVALTQNGWQGERGQSLGFLLLVDTKDKSGFLQTNLAELRQRWTDAGKRFRTEKIQEREFMVLPMSSNDLPKTILKYFPPSSEVQELGDEPSKKELPKRELWLGQADSLLIVGDASKSLEKVLSHLSTNSLPALADSPAFQANYPALLRDAPVYGWVDAKTLIEVWSRKAAAKKENPAAPNPFELIKLDKIITAAGLGGLKSVAFSFQDLNEGGLFQLFLGAPESGRQGILKILAGEAKEPSPPPFVPIEAVKFQRWRLDAQKAWATFEKMLNDISPQWLSGINFMLETANAAAKQKDPSFDIKKNLFGNLGDDIITYEKAPRGSSADDVQNPPSLTLIGSANAEQLALSLKSILLLLSQEAGSPAEREFLGRKIFSVPLPALPIPGADPTKNGARNLNYAASGGYLALSSDPAILEEYLRSSETPRKALRETPGMAEAVQKVTGTGSSLLGYENQLETMRSWFQSMHQDSPADTNQPPPAASLVPGAAAIAAPQQAIKSWIDYSRLPAFDKVSKYFYFSVYGGSATVDGLSFKVFTPNPPPPKKE